MGSAFLIQQGDLAVTDTYISTQASSYNDLTMCYDYGYIQTFVSSSNYDYPRRKKNESIKQRHINESSAFKRFYSKGQYVPVDNNKISKAERIEKVERINKFKGLNENLINGK